MHGKHKYRITFYHLSEICLKALVLNSLCFFVSKSALCKSENTLLFSKVSAQLQGKHKIYININIIFLKNYQNQPNHIYIAGYFATFSLTWSISSCIASISWWKREKRDFSAIKDQQIPYNTLSLF